MHGRKAALEHCCAVQRLVLGAAGADYALATESRKRPATGMASHLILLWIALVIAILFLLVFRRVTTGNH